ncbi:MAG: hypothetical protein Ct9H300mP4_10320 [Gammaproteobacteria bacterium]|nr:MAG: hypothetical protein Ct9H300mP4_10320 [Gammaproteobacteria bacterium]
MKILRIFIGLLIVTSLPIAAQQASSLDELLQNVEQGKVSRCLGQPEKRK